MDADLESIVMSEDKLPAGPAFARLVEIMARLRAPGGCPWDREQNFDTIKPYLIEETYEVLDAIDARDLRGLTEELGDLLLQPVFFAQMAAEEDRFDIADSLDAINRKAGPPPSARVRRGRRQDRRRRKAPLGRDQSRREEAGASPKGLLDGFRAPLPALVEAQQIASKAAGGGFDWENPEQVFEKLR